MQAIDPTDGHYHFEVADAADNLLKKWCVTLQVAEAIDRH